MASRDRVAVVGVGYSKIGRRTGLTLEQLTAQASVAAMADAGLGSADIDGVVVHSFPHQYVGATQTADMLGIPDLAFYSGSVDGAAYSVAALHGIAAVASGSCQTCLTMRTVHQAGAAGGHRSPARSWRWAAIGQFLVPLRLVHRFALGRDVHEASHGPVRHDRGAFRRVRSRPARLRDPQPRRSLHAIPSRSTITWSRATSPSRSTCSTATTRSTPARP